MQAQSGGMLVDFDNIDVPFSAFYTTFSKVDNPDKSGINTSEKVGLVTSSSASTWEGLYNSLPFDKMDFTNGAVISVKVYAPSFGSVLMKIEDAADSENNPLNIAKAVTKIGEWEEISFDFEGAASGLYDRVVLFFDFGGTIDAEDWYFDDIRIVDPSSRDSIVTLSAMFGSGMVLQQSADVAVWGWAPPGDTVEINTSWGGITTAYADTTWRWEATLSTPAALPGEAPQYNMNITGKQNSITLENILIGDVWLCSGQSNMEMGLVANPPWTKGVLNYEEEIANANYPSIRLFKVQRSQKATPQENLSGAWQECNPESVASFSAAAYFFGRELFSDPMINIPIGLINSSYGGSSCQAWTKMEVLETDVELNAEYLAPYIANPGSVNPEEQPTLLYNGMIAPIVPFSLKGITWYQGESNQDDGDMYRVLCTAMLESWREDWGNNDLPFYYVQMTPFIWDSWMKEPYYAYLREAQQNMLDVPNTGMAVSIDVGDPLDIHPRNKQAVGNRLALWARAKTYNQNIVFSGPLYKEMIVEAEKIRIKFQEGTTGSGLAAKDGGDLTHFFISGDDKVFYPAKAMIDGNDIVVSNSFVNNPVAVRYAFSNAPEPNLMNLEELPAAPFRTDEWSDVTIISLVIENETQDQDHVQLQNYPNPFNTSTLISYLLPASESIKIVLYNLQGKEVATLVDEYQVAGKHSLEFSGDQLSAGIYLYKISGAGFNIFKKMIMM